MAGGYPGEAARFRKGDGGIPRRTEFLGIRRSVDLVDAAARLAKLIAGVGRRAVISEPGDEHPLQARRPAVDLGVAARNRREAEQCGDLGIGSEGFEGGDVGLAALRRGCLL